MAPGTVRWRTRFRVYTCILLFLIQHVNGYEQLYTISHLSPKSISAAERNHNFVLETSQTENVAFRIEPSIKIDDVEAFTPENIIRDVEEEKHVIVARSADPNDRDSRSINFEEMALANNNEIDNELELHNKRKYFDLHPTKTLSYMRNRDDVGFFKSSDGFGDRFEFRFPGEANRVPKARALAPSGPKVRPTAVQPIFATATYREQGRQNTEIQNIITGIVKLLNGNVNVQANSQLLRPGRPMASRINNRGPPRISDVPPLPDLERPVTPIHAFVPTKTPPPYPFDRPPHHGVNLPEQIVPPMTPHRPGFHRPIPPWQRPRPTRPPNRKPNPGLPMYKPIPPVLPIDIPDLDSKPEDEITVSENETSHSENNIHNDEKENVSMINLPEVNVTEGSAEDSSKEGTTVTDLTTPSSTSTTTTSTTTEKTTETVTETSTEKTTENTETTSESNKKPTENTTIETVKLEKTDKPVKIEKEKKKETFVSEKEKQNKDKIKIGQSEDNINKTTEKVSTDVIESSIRDKLFDLPSSDLPTPTEGLASHVLDVIPSEVIKTTSTNKDTPSSGIPYHPYRPRPGIVLDDPEFKPKGSRRQPAVVITAPERPLYGEIFDVTVSAIQGGGGDVHVENVNLHHGEHDDIIVSASGDQGFVSIDGKRTYLNLFDTSTSAVDIRPSKVQQPQEHSTLHQPPSQSHGIGTGIAIPADDILQEPIQKPQPSHGTHGIHSHSHGHGTSHESSHGIGLGSHVPASHGPPHRPQQGFRRPHPTVRIDTCIVGDDSTCDQAQNEKCRTEAGISSCQCRPGYARRVHRDPCRKVVALLLNMRVDRMYETKVVWNSKLADKESDLYQQLSYEGLRAIDSAFSMTPFSDDFVSGSVNSIHQGDEEHRGVYVNYTILLQESAESLRPAVAADIQRHLVGVVRRRANNVGASALYLAGPVGAVLPLHDVDECSSPDLNDCHQLATCTNTWGGFRCACMEGTRDAGGSAVGGSGRRCESCSAAHCSERGTCRYLNNQPYCSCNSGYYGSACETDGEVVGVAVGASLAAALVIALTLAALLSWSRKWSREQKAGMGSPVFSYMAANTIKTPPVGQPPYQVTLEERMRWAQIAEAMAQAQANHYAQPDAMQTMATRPSSAMFGYPALPPVPLPRLGLHSGHHTGTLNTVASRANTAASHHNLYGYTNHLATESSSSEASSHAQDRADLLVPRPKSRARTMHNQTGIYYDVEYENAPEAIYGTKGIPLSTYTVSRGPPFYR